MKNRIDSFETNDTEEDEDIVWNNDGSDDEDWTDHPEVYGECSGSSSIPERNSQVAVPVGLAHRVKQLREFCDFLLSFFPLTSGLHCAMFMDFPWILFPASFRCPLSVTRRC